MLPPKTRPHQVIPAGQNAHTLDVAVGIDFFQLLGDGIQLGCALGRIRRVGAHLFEERRLVGDHVGVAGDHHAPELAIPPPGIPELREIVFAVDAGARWHSR